MDELVQLRDFKKEYFITFRVIKTRKNKENPVFCKTSVLTIIFTEYSCSSFSIYIHFFLLSVLFAGSSRHIVSACRANNSMALVSCILFDGRIPVGRAYPPLLPSTRKALPLAIYPHVSVHPLVCNIQHQPPLPSTVKCTRNPVTAEPFFIMCIQYHNVTYDDYLHVPRCRVSK